MPMTSRAATLRRASVSGGIRATKSVAGRPARGINVACSERRAANDVFAVCPCHVDASNKMIDPGDPCASTSSGCGANGSANISSGGGLEIRQCRGGEGTSKHHESTVGQHVRGRRGESVHQCRRVSEEAICQPNACSLLYGGRRKGVLRQRCGALICEQS